MAVPAVTRHRRPFLAPVWLTLLAVLAAVGVAWGMYRSASTTVVVLAAPLQPQVEQGAERLARLFGAAQGLGHVDAVYVSEAPPAQQASAPLVRELRTRAIVVPGKDAGDIASRVMDEHQGDTVVLIGSSELLPQLMLELSGLELSPTEKADANALYILSIPSFGQSNVVRVRY